MKRTFIAAALALSVGAAFANPDAVVIGAGGADFPQPLRSTTSAAKWWFWKRCR